MPEIRDISPYQRLGLLELNKFARENNLSEKRQAEVAGTRYLLNALLKGERCQLRYTEHNKPYLEGRAERISISHSHDLLAVLMNTKEEAGVDIELIREKVLRIRHKFLNASEMKFAGNDLVKLISLWAAKESLYKVYGRKKLDFCSHLYVDPFEGDEINGMIKTGPVNKRFAMRRERLGDYILVYIVNEIPVVNPQAH